MPQQVGIMDTTQVMTGKDGRCYVEVDGENYFLAEVNVFNVNMNVNIVDEQPVGNIVVGGVPTGVTFSISFTEMVIRDDLIMEPLLEAIRAGKIPNYTFQTASVRQTDGQEQRMTLRSCVPEGEFNLMALTPGEVIKRNQSYRINRVPEWLKALAAPKVLTA